jgi:hypothetical protein
LYFGALPPSLSLSLSLSLVSLALLLVFISSLSFFLLILKTRRRARETRERERERDREGGRAPKYKMDVEKCTYSVCIWEYGKLGKYFSTSILYFGALPPSLSLSLSPIYACSLWMIGLNVFGIRRKKEREEMKTRRRASFF